MPNTIKRLLALYTQLQQIERRETKGRAPDCARLLKLRRVQARVARRIALQCATAPTG